MSKTLLLVALGGFAAVAYAAESSTGKDATLLGDAESCACESDSLYKYANNKDYSASYNDECAGYPIYLQNLVTYGTLSSSVTITQTPEPSQVMYERRNWNLGCGCGYSPALYHISYDNPYKWDRIPGDCLEIEMVCGKPVEDGFGLLGMKKTLERDAKHNKKSRTTLLQRGDGPGPDSAEDRKDEQKSPEPYRAWSVRIATCDTVYPPITVDYFHDYYQLRCLKDESCCKNCVKSCNK